MTSPACVREHSTMRSLAGCLLDAAQCVQADCSEAMLFVGDDWAEDHHDVEIVDDTGGGRWHVDGCPNGLECTGPHLRDVGRPRHQA